MTNFLRPKSKLKANSFTLVELLVVISIIGLLAGLAVPAIQGGLEKAKQQADVQNIRQLHLVFFGEANDNAGMYRRNLDLTNTNLGNVMDVYKGAIADRTVTALKVFAGNGVRVAANSNSFTADNCAFAYGLGLDVNDDPEIALFLTKGNGAQFGTADITLDKTKSPWKDRGLVVVRLGGDAFFLKAKDGKVVNALSTNRPYLTSAKIEDPK